MTIVPHPITKPRTVNDNVLAFPAIFFSTPEERIDQILLPEMQEIFGPYAKNILSKI